jgi:3-phosphoshikimate 1-carboxyvinyltransferase
VAQRALVAALLASGASTLRNLTLCSDTEAALGVVRALGAEVGVGADGSYRITSRFPAGVGGGDRRTIFCGESGLLTRIMAPVSALLAAPTEITGHGSLATRPVDMVEAPLRSLGASVRTRAGRLPMLVRGPLGGGEATVDGALSSQLLTGLLMALPLAPSDSLLHVRNLKSRPYVDVTLALLKAFGVAVEHERYELFRIAGRQRYAPCTYGVEGDWSGASCPLVAGAIAGSVTVRNLDLRSAQADREIMAALRLAGANLSVEADGGSGLSSVTAARGALRSFAFDATHCPDLFPAIAALAACCDGVSVVRGASRLAHKESNRALTLQQELGALGVAVELQEDAMLVTGGRISGGRVRSHNDHRIAMALATVALCADGEVLIEQPESVEKSYPAFWEDLEALTV